MIVNLQILRALAAINVVLFHVIETGAGYAVSPGIFEFLRGWGANGVDVFFVISGFVIVYSQVNKKRGVFDFIKLRIVRIFPIYWFVTFFTYLIFLFLPASYLNQDAPSVERFLVSLFFLAGVLTDHFPLVYVGWTLEWEVLFYIVFGLSLLFKGRVFSYFFVFSFIVLFSFVSSNFIAVEFLMGVVVALVYGLFVLDKKVAIALLVSGVILLCASIGYDQYDSGLRVLYWGIPAALIVFGAAYAPPVQNGVLKMLGDASYSIYLVQMLTIPGFYKVATALFSGVNASLLVILCLVLSVISGVLMYFVIERPMSLYLKKKIPVTIASRVES